LEHAGHYPLPLNPAPEPYQAADKYRARLARIEGLLGTNPALADQQAAELLRECPDQPVAMLYQAIARRLLQDPVSAISILTPLSIRHPRAPMVHLQLGLALREDNQPDAAVKSLNKSVEVRPDFADAWLALADLLTSMADKPAANGAYIRYVQYAEGEPRIREAATALRENRLLEAEELLRHQLLSQPNDIVVLCMLAEIVDHLGRATESEVLLEKCLALAPDYHRARQNYALVLMRHNKPGEAMRETQRLLAEAPGKPDYLKLRAAIHIKLREYADAISIYQTLLNESMSQADVWTSLGHAMKAVGRRDDCLKAYRQALTVDPGYGEAYWSIANVKTEHFTAAETEIMQQQVTGPAISEAARIGLHFALGKSLEDKQEYARSFHHYAAGNRLQNKITPYDPHELSAYVQRCKQVFTQAWFAERSGSGAEDTDPIFIVGLPRSGSTLVEQILSSHSRVEGTTELTEIIAMAKSLADWQAGSETRDYPSVLSTMEKGLFRELGEAYINQTRVYRRQGRPMFIDKMPGNFAHIGLIQLILPNARIIDVRRHPLASGFSIYKQHFARGQEFSYSLECIGSYYRNYVELMALFDRVHPGRVYRVFYEALVNDTENEVRRLLQYCQLPFEATCLEFYKNDRAVSTPSAEQVRSPIFRDAVYNWVPYEAWLAPLKTALADLIADYPQLPVSMPGA